MRSVAELAFPQQTVMQPAPRPASPPRAPETGWGGTALVLEPGEFARKFSRAPFLIGHNLASHPLFDAARLLELAKRLPESNIEYNAGKLPVSISNALTPRNGLSVEETIRRIEQCESWMVLKNVQDDPEYGRLLEQCLDEFRPHAEPIVPGMRFPQAFVFLTSPRSITPFHIDPEHNFLLQIRGTKTIYQFDGHDREILTEEMLENFYATRVRNQPFDPEHNSRAWVFNLQPGQGLHFPVTYPHWVENGPEVSISFSITWRTPDLQRRSSVYRFNHWLRRRGLVPMPPGRSAWRDGLKYQCVRTVDKVRSLLGKG
jgi:hypothetical protein